MYNVGLLYRIIQAQKCTQFTEILAVGMKNVYAVDSRQLPYNARSMTIINHLYCDNNTLVLDQLDNYFCASVFLVVQTPEDIKRQPTVDP